MLVCMVYVVYMYMYTIYMYRIMYTGRERKVVNKVYRCKGESSTIIFLPAGIIAWISLSFISPQELPLHMQQNMTLSAYIYIVHVN